MSYSFETPWTVVHLAPLSMAFPRQEYCSGFPFPSQGDLPDPGIKPASPAFAGNSLPGKPLVKKMATHSSILGWEIP